MKSKSIRIKEETFELINAARSKILRKEHSIRATDDYVIKAALQKFLKGETDAK